MAIIIDRRLNPSGKNHINRQKFLDRAREQIRDAIQDSVTNKNLKDVGSNEKVKVRNKDIAEPSFHNDRATGNKKQVLPGNREFEEGDTSPKPITNSGRGQGKEAGTGDSLDEFEFTLTREEFLSYLFEDLELPDFIKETIKVTDHVKYSKTGFTNTGTPANLNIEKTFKKSIGRRLALDRPTDEEVAEAYTKWIYALENELSAKELEELHERWKDLEARQKRVPFIEENDLRYTNYEQKPQPAAQAVMFCLMDVSGSMGEYEKDIAKKFFLLLYLFLEKKYDKIDIRFIRHTEHAEEVDEHTFFYSKESGGTLISSGLILIDTIIKDEYPLADWNIYIAQCTDSDNIPDDNEKCRAIITDSLQKIVQYYSYIHIGEPRPIHAFMGVSWSSLPMFTKLAEDFNNIECRKITNPNQVWTVFRSLFERK